MKVELISKEMDVYDQALDLRYKLFFKELNLPKGIEKDDLENASEHLCIVEDGSLIAYARLTELEPGHFKISQVVVHPSKQGHGYGTSLLKGVVEVAKHRGAASIELNSQVSAMALYHKLGFKVQGAQFPSKSTGIAHVKMVLSPIT